MSAFQAYAGSYELDGDAFSWRCYATSRVYEIRRSDHTPFPKAPQGRKWVAPARQDYAQQVHCLIDAHVEEFSQILLQVQPQAQPAARTSRRSAEVEVASAAA